MAMLWWAVLGLVEGACLVERNGVILRFAFEILCTGRSDFTVNDVFPPQSRSCTLSRSHRNSQLHELRLIIDMIQIPQQTTQMDYTQ